MTSYISPQLVKAEENHAQERIYKLLVRCVQEMRLLNKKLNDRTYAASYLTLQQRLKELEQRQKFYQTQLDSLTVYA